MKSKINVIVGSVLALAITATAPVHAKGSDYIGQGLSAEPMQQSQPIPVNSAPGDREAGRHRYRVAGGHR